MSAVLQRIIKRGIAGGAHACMSFCMSFLLKKDAYQIEMDATRCGVYVLENVENTTKNLLPDNH